LSITAEPGTDAHPAFVHFCHLSFGEEEDVQVI
jgi:hypothetical protein